MSALKPRHTIAGYHLTREERRNAVEYTADVERPRTRGDCVDGERPCPFVTCKFHLYLDVNPTSGSIHLTYPTLEVDELAETCALDIADRGGAYLEYIADLLNLTRERIRQIETMALAHAQESMPASAGIFADR